MRFPARLTWSQIDKIEVYTPHLAEVFHHDITPATDMKADVVAPFVAWEQLVAVVSERFATRGARPRDHHTRTMRSLVAEPAKAMARMMMHPALQGRAKAGQHYGDGAIPAWRQPEDAHGRIWSPKPNGDTFELLSPRVLRIARIDCTVWDHLGFVADHWTYDPELHEAISSHAPLPALKAAPTRPT